MLQEKQLFAIFMTHLIKLYECTIWFFIHYMLTSFLIHCILNMINLKSIASIQLDISYNYMIYMQQGSIILELKYVFLVGNMCVYLSKNKLVYLSVINMKLRLWTARFVFTFMWKSVFFYLHMKIETFLTWYKSGIWIQYAYRSPRQDGKSSHPRARLQRVSPNFI